MPPLMRHLAVVHHRDGVAELAGEGEVLLDHQQGRLAVLQLAEGVDHVGDDGRRQPLGRLVDQQQPARLDDGARHRQHLLLAARQKARRQVSRTASAPRSGAKIQSSRLWIGRARARGQHQILLHREVGEDRHALGHIGDAQPRDVGRRQAA